MAVTGSILLGDTQLHKSCVRNNVPIYTIGTSSSRAAAVYMRKLLGYVAENAGEAPRKSRDLEIEVDLGAPWLACTRKMPSRWR